MLCPYAGHWSADLAREHALVLVRINEDKRGDAAQRVQPHPRGQVDAAFIAGIHVATWLSLRWPGHWMVAVTSEIGVAAYWVYPEYLGHRDYLIPGPLDVSS